jgi:hypothetical protein
MLISLLQPRNCRNRERQQKYWLVGLRSGAADFEATWQLQSVSNMCSADAVIAAQIRCRSGWSDSHQIPMSKFSFACERQILISY